MSQDAAAQAAIRTDLGGVLPGYALQRIAIDEVASIPVGADQQSTALRLALVDRVPGLAMYWGLRTA